jgi:hypothetical protein
MLSCGVLVIGLSLPASAGMGWRWNRVEAEPAAMEQLPLVQLAEGEQLPPGQVAEQPELAEADFIALASNRETSRPALQATSGTSST